MIEYAEDVLPKIAGYQELFVKELFKCIDWIESPEELDDFREWCYENFDETYSRILDVAFSSKAET